jgi:predicted amidophosphoribosyltransferase
MIFMPLIRFGQDDWLPLTVKRCLLCGHELGADDDVRFLTCACAGRQIRTENILCPVCLAELVPIQGRRCRCCGIKLLSEQNVCTVCRERSYAFKAHLAIFPYRGLVKEIIYQFKFQKQKAFAGLLAYFFAQTWERNTFGLLSESASAPAPDCLPLVPVAASPGRHRQPGTGLAAYPQGAIQYLGAYLKEHYGFKLWDVLMCLGKAPQKELDFATRLQNVQGRFMVKPERQQTRSGPGKPPEQVLLIDDVFTTGATANECARVLSAAGVKQVYVMTLAQDW